MPPGRTPPLQSRLHATGGDTSFESSCCSLQRALPQPPHTHTHTTLARECPNILDIVNELFLRRACAAVHHALSLAHTSTDDGELSRAEVIRSLKHDANVSSGPKVARRVALRYYG